MKVKMAADYATSGKWVVRTSDAVERTFDAVIVCTGHHSYPYTPKLNGLDAFQVCLAMMTRTLVMQGRVVHSQSVHNHYGFEGARVLVVGFGNSAVDIAVKLCRHAKKVRVIVWQRYSCVTVCRL